MALSGLSGTPGGARHAARQVRQDGQLAEHAEPLPGKRDTTSTRRRSLLRIWGGILFMSRSGVGNARGLRTGNDVLIEPVGEVWKLSFQNSKV